MAKTNQNFYTIPILRFYQSHFFSRRVFPGIVFLQLLIPHYSHAQFTDTLIAAKADSVARQDTTKKKSSGIDTSVVYSAVDSIVYSYPKKVMMMYGKGDVKYPYAWTEIRAHRCELE